MHHAGAAQAGAASVLGAGELEAFPDHPQQRRLRRRVGRRRLAVHSEVDGHDFLLGFPRRALRRGRFEDDYASAALTRAGWNGKSRMRLPVAWAKALATAA